MSGANNKTRTKSTVLIQIRSKQEKKWTIPWALTDSMGMTIVKNLAKIHGWLEVHCTTFLSLQSGHMMRGRLDARWVNAEALDCCATHGEGRMRKRRCRHRLLGRGWTNRDWEGNKWMRIVTTGGLSVRSTPSLATLAMPQGCHVG